MAAIAAFFAVISPPVAASQAPAATTAFVNVNVLTMREERIASGQTVLVQGDRIVRVGASGDVTVPPGALVIDGDGQYLLPGLTDAHVHLPTGMAWAQTREDFGDAPIYLSYGVTTVMNLGGSAVQLDWRRRVDSGEWLGPTVYSAGPFVNEPRVTTPEEVAQDVAAQAKAGFDLIKFHELPQTTTGLSAAAYRRMIEAASQAHLPLIGHAPVNLGLDEMLSAHQSIAHLGVLSNIYFLPFASHPATLLTSGVAAFLIVVIAILAMMAKLVRRVVEDVPRLPRDNSRRQLRHISVTMAVATAAAATAALAFLPGGPLFDSLLLRIVFTALAAIVAGASVMAVVLCKRQFVDRNASLAARLHTLTVATAGSVLSILLFIFWIPVAWRSADRGIEGLAQRLHEAGIVVQSTLVVYESLSAEGRLAFAADPGLDLLLPSTRDAWRQSAAAQPGPPLLRLRGFMQKVVAALERHGVPIMAGTDAMGLELIAPGSSLHRELQLLFSSGLSAYDVLRAATVVPAAFLGKSQEFGTVAPGQRADLLLVGGNPLEDLTVLKQPRGVMVRGRWCSREALDAMLEDLPGKD